MAASALETRSTAGQTALPLAPGRHAPETVERSDRIRAVWRAPSLIQLTVLAFALIAGIGALVWHFAGGDADGAIVAGIVTAGLAVLVGSYASVFVTWGRR